MIIKQWPNEQKTCFVCGNHLYDVDGKLKAEITGKQDETGLRDAYCSYACLLMIKSTRNFVYDANKNHHNRRIKFAIRDCRLPSQLLPFTCWYHDDESDSMFRNPYLMYPASPKADALLVQQMKAYDAEHDKNAIMSTLAGIAAGNNLYMIYKL